MIHLNLMPLLGLLLLFHLMYDYHWQGNYISAGKRTSNFILTVHAVTWALFMSVPLYLFTHMHWWTFPWLVTTHWAMDWYKGHRMDGARTRSHVIDQTVHLLSLIPCL
jgi:hypothetical protein